MTNREPPRITKVYSFANGMTMVFDQYGQQMPDFQGYTSEVMPKIRAAGFAGDVPYGSWRPDPPHFEPQKPTTSETGNA